MLNDLIARIEAATEGSRELDEKIAYRTQWRPENVESKQSFADHERKHDYHTAWIAHVAFRAQWAIPPWTASLDAALTLAGDQWLMALQKAILRLKSFMANPPSRDTTTREERSSLLLARLILNVCGEALKVRAAEKATNA